MVSGAPFGTSLQCLLRQALICINCGDNETRLADAFALGGDDFIRRSAAIATAALLFFG